MTVIGDERGDTPAVRAIGFYVPRSTFPAGRGQIIAEAHRSRAPEELVRRLRALDGPPTVYLDPEEVVGRLFSGDTVAEDRSR